MAHVACAVGTPSIVLLGGGHFGRFFPYSPLTSAVCLPLQCYQCLWRCPYQRAHCVKDIRGDVLAAAIAMTLDQPAQLPRVFLQDRSLYAAPGGGPEWTTSHTIIPRQTIEVVAMGRAASDPPDAPLRLTPLRIPIRHCRHGVPDDLRQVVLARRQAVLACFQEADALLLQRFQNQISQLALDPRSRNLPAPPEEAGLIDEILAGFGRDREQVGDRFILAAMLYLCPSELPALPDQGNMSPWLLPTYRRYLTAQP